MAYGVKYRTEWKDLFGTSRRIDIKEADYTGEISTERSHSCPAVFKNVPDNDHLPILRASALDVALISPSRMYFRSLFTSNKFKYQVCYYSGSLLTWMGYVISDFYSEPYDDRNYPVTIKATDGLSFLQNIPFVDDDGDDYTGKRTDLEIIAICLGKLGLDLEIMTFVNIYEERLVVGSTTDPLALTKTDSYIYKDKDCLTVLQETLRPYGAQIFQQLNGIDLCWNIVRPTSIFGASYIGKVYNASGTYQYSITVSPRVTLTNNHASDSDRNVLVMGRTNVDIVPAIKEMSINFDYGLRDNLISGGDFDIDDFEWDRTRDTPGYYTDLWTNRAGLSAYGVALDRSTGKMALRLLESYDYPLHLPGYGVLHFRDNADYVELVQDIELEQDADAKFIFEGEFRVDTQQYPEYEETALNNYDHEVLLMIVVKVGSYTLANGQWVDNLSLFTPDVIYSVIRCNQDYVTIQLEAESIPENGQLSIRIYQVPPPPVYEEPSTVGFYLWIRSIKAKVFNDDEIQSELNLLTIVDENNNLIPGELELASGDLPDISNNEALYSNGKWLPDGRTTKQWQIPGSAFVEPLIVSLARMISDQRLRPKIKYVGTVEDSRIKPGSLVIDPWEDIKLMVHEITSHNLATNEMQVILIEVLEEEERQIIDYPDDGIIRYPKVKTIVYPKRRSS